MIISILLAVIFSLLLVISVANYVMRLVRPTRYDEYGDYGFRRNNSVLPMILLCVGIAIMVGRVWASDTDDFIDRIVNQLSASTSEATVSEADGNVEIASELNSRLNGELATLGEKSDYIQSDDTAPAEAVQTSPSTLYGLQYQAGSNFAWANSALEDLRVKYPGADILVKEDGTGMPFKIVLYTAYNEKDAMAWLDNHPELTKLRLISLPASSIQP